MNEIASVFKMERNPVFIYRYGSGHINETYLIIDEIGREYILQKINRNIFADIDALMNNITAVTGHLRKTAQSYREVLNLVRTKQDKSWFEAQDGAAWRMYEFVSDSICLDRPECTQDFYQTGRAWGQFQRQMADFPAESLTETIIQFHDTPNRYKLFHEALSADTAGRAATVREEIEFFLAREEYAATLMRRKERGELPLRVTHNDTKLNNVLLDRITRKPLCVIDLDTVMPGLSVNDFGDSIRFGASTAVEDEQDLEKVSFSVALFEAYTSGFLKSCGQSLSEGELASLCDGAKTMTLECGLRFLTDYLCGDTYFRIARGSHNLDRSRTQIKLIKEMEAQWQIMQSIVEREAASVI